LTIRSAPRTMQANPILSQVVLGYSPIIDRQRSVVATRLTLFPERPDFAPDAAVLLGALVEAWPAPAGAKPKAGALQPVSLNLAGEALLDAVLGARPSSHLMVEVPAFMAADPARAASIQALCAAGGTLVAKGRPLADLAPELQRCFAHAILD